ncbi:hypothetical protein QT196_29110 [Streptomyces sp. P9-2B-2]|uniref:hypothetical protein n=1 Tax=Streptomyces sp. P9-2B-2 TaxID=3057114 RepID=UPI0025B31E90|nr:hypothetical protein [Streptomyces sp. P9-2B-2]WJY41008.1 hypothetical protein QT196_29110 [Streptomyces sp. P9-2B-2]
MGANGEYGVDLDALNSVIGKLNHVLQNMDEPVGHSKNGTYLPKGALGRDFKEEGDLHNAHDAMKAAIEELVGKVQNLIKTFGGKSAKVRDAYQDAEAENRIGMR